MNISMFTEEIKIYLNVNINLLAQLLFFKISKFLKSYLNLVVQALKSRDAEVTIDPKKKKINEEIIK